MIVPGHGLETVHKGPDQNCQQRTDQQNQARYFFSFIHDVLLSVHFAFIRLCFLLLQASCQEMEKVVIGNLRRRGKINQPGIWVISNPPGEKYTL